MREAKRILHSAYPLVVHEKPYVVKPGIFSKRTDRKYYCTHIFLHLRFVYVPRAGLRLNVQWIIDFLVFRDRLHSTYAAMGEGVWPLHAFTFYRPNPRVAQVENFHVQEAHYYELLEFLNEKKGASGFDT